MLALVSSNTVPFALSLVDSATEELQVTLNLYDPWFVIFFKSVKWIKLQYLPQSAILKIK